MIMNHSVWVVCKWPHLSPPSVPLSSATEFNERTKWRKGACCTYSSLGRSCCPSRSGSLPLFLYRRHCASHFVSWPVRTQNNTVGRSLLFLFTCWQLFSKVNTSTQFQAKICTLQQVLYVCTGTHTSLFHLSICPWGIFPSSCLL